MNEHPIEQPIQSIQLDVIPGSQVGYSVGQNGITRIEACEKSGPYSMVPYIRVFADDQCVSEFCQHNIVGIFFAAVPNEQN